MKKETEQQHPGGEFACSAWFCVSWSAVECGLVWWAVATGMPGPGNIVKLMALINAVVSPLALLSAATSKDTDKRKPWLRHWMTTSDVAQVLVLCWWGWWWCSVAYTMGAIASAAIRYRKGQTQNDPSPATRP
jgi:hypothetical protein